MNEKSSDEQVRLLAYALFQLRVLLSSELIEKAETPRHIHVAARYAYAVHNEALAVYEGRAFDPKELLAKLERFDSEFGENLLVQYRRDHGAGNNAT